RDCRSLFELFGGRFQPGIGGGLDPAPPGARLARLRELAAAIREGAPGARLLLAASGRRGLALAAEVADTVAIGLPPRASEDQVAERVDWLREAAGPRFDDIELNVSLAAVGDARLPYDIGATPGELQQA